jgi:NAD(P)-dependent dehydrogenase (short-subunit alcohol dehydrogenase family)
MPRLDLNHRVVLITGAARGIGACTARQLHDRGAQLSLVGLEFERIAALAEKLGPRATASEADVTDHGALEAAVAATRERFGGIDVVIANAGVAPPSEPVLTIDPEAFERTIEVDLLGVWRTVRAALPSVVERRGHVVVIASIYAFFNGAVNASYAMSKAGVEQLGRALRVELAPHGATAGVAYFGFIDTDMVRDAFRREAVARVREAFPGWVSEPIPVEAASAALVRGIERRSPRVSAPRWVTVALAFRGVLDRLDERLAADERMVRAVRAAEEARR